jgi:uncharacterized membrane protein
MLELDQLPAPVDLNPLLIGVVVALLLLLLVRPRKQRDRRRGTPWLLLGVIVFALLIALVIIVPEMRFTMSAFDELIGTLAQIGR